MVDLFYHSTNILNIDWNVTDGAFNIVKSSNLFLDIFLTWTRILEYDLQRYLKVSLKMIKKQYLKWRKTKNVMNDIFFLSFGYTHVVCICYIRLWQLFLTGNISVVYCFTKQYQSYEDLFIQRHFETKVYLYRSIFKIDHLQMLSLRFYNLELNPVWCHQI